MGEPLNNEREGFICPFCLVSFATASALSGHFLKFHTDADDESQPLINVEEAGKVSSSGHNFKSCIVPKPCPCHHCKEVVWQDGLMCSVCKVIIHPGCLPAVSGKCAKPRSSVDKEFSSSGSSRLSILSLDESIPPQPPRSTSIQIKVKHMVARNRERYIDDEFDLDLTYITDRIIAMSFPATGVETTYRNSLKDVAKMLNAKHKDKFMIFNVSERSYDISKFNNQVLDFGWPDHLAPSLERLSSICKSMKSWLDTDHKHVAVVHCKGGKGRTGCVIAAFIHYTELCDSAQDALEYFAMKRFRQYRVGSGVTQPSQRRYVYYFSDILKGKATMKTPPILLRHIIIHGAPDFDGKGGCRPFVKIYQDLTLLTTSGLYVCSQDSPRIKITFYEGVKMQGEILVKCFHKRQHSVSGMDVIFRTQFHTSFIPLDELSIVLSKTELDEAHKDKRFPDNAKIEFIFSPYMEQHSDPGVHQFNGNQIRDSLLDGLEKPSSASTGSEMSKSDSYQDFREVEELIKATHHDLINLDSPVVERKPVDRVPGPADESLYTVVTKNKKSPKAARRPLPPSPTNTEQTTDMADRIKEYKKVFKEGRNFTQQEGSQPNELTALEKKYNYVDVDQKVSVNCPSRDNQWGEFRYPNGDHAGGEQDGNISDYFNVNAISEGQNFVMQTSVEQNGTSNRHSIIAISRPQQPADPANGPYPQEDYINNPHELIAAQEAAEEHTHGLVASSNQPQLDYINSDILSQALVAENDQIYSEPPDSREYVNTDNLDLTDSFPPQDNVEAEQSSSSTKEERPNVLSSIASALKSKFSSQKGPSTVQSAEITPEERERTLGGFNLQVPLKKMQVKGEDYFFVKDTWGESPNVTTQPPQSERPPPQSERPPPLPKSRPTADLLPRRPLGAPSTSGVGASPAAITSPSIANQPLPPIPTQPRPSMPTQPLPPIPSQQPPALPGNHPSKLKPQRRTVHNLPSGDHPPPVNSEGPGGRQLRTSGTKPPLATKPSLENRAQVSRQKSAPMGDLPQSDPFAVSRKDVEDRKALWYKNNVSREQAIEQMKKSEAGSFIVRDSSTVTGGYALTIRVSEDSIRTKLKLPPDIIVTDDMCVKHFLIQPDRRGVRLQGWNEKPFSDLVDFIQCHCQERLCLPCVLVLPKNSEPATRPRPTRRPQDQAATDLIYIGMVDVSGPGSPEIISSVADQLKSLSLCKPNVVNFKASRDGLTVTDTVSGNFVKRFHPLNTISFCSVDVSDTRWDFESLQYRGKLVSVKRAKCFGFVWKPNEKTGYMCGLFGELEPSQPVGAIVHFINKLLRDSNRMN